MWEKLQHAAQHPVMQFLKKICGDPVQLYAVLLMTTIMQYYHSGFTWLYTIASVFLSWGMMKFYDFVAKHQLIGPLCYLVYMLFGTISIGAITSMGRLDYPISFGVWFLTPQGVVDFSIWYTLAIYGLMLGFLTSAVYYFAKVRYRMVMQFLIMLIPLSLYAKEGIQAPALLVIVTLSAYFLLMVYCRQLREMPGVKRLSNMQTGMSVTIYVLIFSILAAVFPKPNVKADREYIENAMAYSSWSDILMEAISMFNDTASTGGSNGSNDDRTMYYAYSMEALRLRTQTFTYYQQDDSWKALEIFDYPNSDYETMLVYAPRDLMVAILRAAALDADFAETYHLSDLTDMTPSAQDPRVFEIYPNFYGSTVLPAPTRLHALETYEQPQTFVSAHNAMAPIDEPYRRREPISMTYYSDAYANDAKTRELLGRLEADTYEALLTDAAAILAVTDPDAAALLESCLTERADAFAYLEKSDGLSWQSSEIDALAAEITEGLTSDYEKAKAIERYFAETGFVYDLNYQKETGENAEDFLFVSRRGVCYEFATAMVLLCRSAGLPARYTQGYSMTEPYVTEIDGAETNFYIKLRNSHAFPEVYISGYGWLSFEPTVAMDEEEEVTKENHYVMIWGFVILGAAVLAGAVYILLPKIRERNFRRQIARMVPREAAAAIFVRMRKTLKLAESSTVMELAAHSRPFCNENAAMQQLFERLDALLYDKKQRSATPDAALAAAYVQWQECRIQYEKDLKKQQKRSRRQKRAAE